MHMQYTPGFPDGSGVGKTSGLSGNPDKQEGQFLRHEISWELTKISKYSLKLAISRNLE